MAQLDEHGRPESEPSVGEIETLLGFLDYQRATLAWKCSGMNAAGMQAKVAASSMTLGGLLMHLACIEDWWFSQWLHGNDEASPWDKVDWKAHPDWAWDSAAEDAPEELRKLWEDAVNRSRTLVAEALATAGLDQRRRAPGRGASRRACDGSWCT
jgi:uncharacterized damage-inducible protein DinB